MKKNFKSLLNTLVKICFIFLISKNLYANETDDLCKNLKSDLLANGSKYLLSYLPTGMNYNDLGFDLKLFWDENKNNWVVTRDENNFLIIGDVLHNENLDKFESGNVVLELNNIKTSEMKDGAEFYQILLDSYDQEQEVEIVIKDNNKEIKKYKLPVLDYVASATILDTEIKSISNIDVKKNEFEVFLRRNLKYNYTKVDGLYKAAKKHLTKENVVLTECQETEADWKKVRNFDPDFVVDYYNIVDFDKTKIDKKYILEFNENVLNDKSKLILTAQETGLYKFSNDFNLRSFPFDKQILKISVFNSQHPLETNYIARGLYQKRNTEFFKNNAKIPGWKITGVETKSSPLIRPTYFEAGSIMTTSIFVEREIGYYIFKVIFPIILILMVCWSVSWINPKELESRLTITIVCLLSLIAYNFVIDSELPKLNYLTVLDWIILISYIYATIPNFLSIATFRLNTSNPKLCLKVENYSKKYGALSYIVLVLLIIMININISPINTGSFLNWLTF